ncbi:MAG: hypothetical protein JRG73_09985 [Deltaproteobacteria bacterium]|nr:hypothetical protein [Deltaproteobacteria bacterium]
MPYDNITPEELTKIIDHLPFQRRLGLVLQLDVRERQDLILLSSHPEPLVHAMPEEELLITIKEIGEEDAIPLISLTSDGQLRYLMDVDVWRRDRLEPSRALQWLSLMLECGEDKVLQWVRSQDMEMVAAVFHTMIHVAKPEEYTAPPEPGSFSPPYTLDNIYYLYFKDPKATPPISQFMEIIRRRDEKFYFWLMEELIWGIPAEREEMAFKWRQARLDEKGFPSLDEALGLYQYLSDREVERIQCSSLTRESAKPAQKPQATGWFLRSLRQGPLILSSVLARVDDAGHIDRMHREFIHLCNMCMVSDGIEPGTIGDIRKSTEKVLHFLNMGLEVLSEGHLHKAIDLLTGLHLLVLFQAGYTQVLKLRLSALEILKFGIPEAGTTILGGRLEGMLRGVYRKRPLFYQDEKYREFRSMDDIGEMREALETIRVLDSLIRDVLGWPLGALGPPPEAAGVGQNKGLTAEKVLLTAMARLVLEGRFRFAPLAGEEASHFLRKVMAGGEDIGIPRCFPEELVSDFFAWLREHWEGATEKGIHVMERFIGRSLQSLSEETAYLNLGEPLDPKSVESLVIECD